MIELDITPTPDQLEYLDLLRESGRTNMFDSVRFLREEWPDLTEYEAKQILVYWMTTFNQRHRPQRKHYATRQR